MLLRALLLALVAPCAAYVRPATSLAPLHTRFRAKIPRTFASSRLNAKLSPFDAFVAEKDGALKDVSKYWAAKATEALHWSKPFASALENGFNSGEIAWFKGGELNVCYNCLDRHLPHLADKPAVIYEGDVPEDTQTLTYAQLHENVCRVANMMVQHGVQKGDVVTTYMPSSPELVTVMLACARIGAVHNVVHTSLSPCSLNSRMNETDSKYVFTFDEWRFKRTRRFLRKDVAEAIHTLPTVKHVFVYRRTQDDTVVDRKRDIILNNVLHLYKKEHESVPMQSEEPLFVLHSTSTSSPHNGYVHSSAGFAVQAATSTQLAFGLQEDDIVGCMVDPGLIAGNTYSVYGPLLNGATTFLYGGAAGYPSHMRYIEMAKRHRLTHLYATTTAFRLMMKADPLVMNVLRLPHLRVIGTFGEPLEETTYKWLHDTLGKGNSTVVNGWMQTQSGALLCSALPGVTPIKPTTCGFPLPGIDLALVDDDGNEITESPAEGKVLVKQPWPAMARRIFGNASRFEERHLKPFPDRFYTGDFGKRDEDGQYSIEGAAEDIINSAGYRISCSELEATLLASEQFKDAAVVGLPDDRVGQSICAFVVPHNTSMVRKEAEDMAKQTSKALLGLFASPDTVHVVTGLPKTASGEVVRSLLTKLALGEKEDFGDTSMLTEKGIMSKLVKQVMPKKIVLKGSRSARQAKTVKKVKKKGDQEKKKTKPAAAKKKKK